MKIILKLKEGLIRILTFDYFMVKRIILREIPQPKKITVLDLGCGTGVLSPLFSPKRYLGIDLDRESIRLAQKKNRHYAYQVADATNFVLSQRFVFILVVGVLHHLNFSQAKAMLTAMERHLKKGGRTLIIEAIPPIWKINFLGHFLRRMDVGKYVRNLGDYRKLVAAVFRVKKAYSQLGGVVDYGVILAEKK